MSVKDQLLNYLFKSNPISVAQARSWFRMWNVTARIHELREEGWPIYTNVRTKADGNKVAVYRLGKPSRSMKAYARQNGIKLHQVA